MFAKWINSEILKSIFADICLPGGQPGWGGLIERQVGCHMFQGRELADRGAKVEDRGTQLIPSWTKGGRGWI